MTPGTPHLPAPSARRMPIIGIVGGIGAGKSEVARLLHRLGCVVSSSDAEAKALLHEPEIQDQLRAWWGQTIVSASGEVDRAALASIVFADPMQRARLEGLLHPKIHERRKQTIAEASRQGARGVIVDAPLLFEAGVDKECDAVIFVDAPQDARIRRVQETRQWTDAELSRREASQWSLEEKRRRSTHLLNNHGSLDDLERETARVLASIIAALA